jgi:hypothetical protein
MKNNKFFTFVLVAIAIFAVLANTNAVNAETASFSYKQYPAEAHIWSEEPQSIYLPNTNTDAVEVAAETQAAEDAEKLDGFVASVVNGNANQIVGIYVNGVLADPVVQQPSGNAGWISEQDDVITQFASASQFNVTGMLAHNTHAGIKFFNLEVGQEVLLVKGDGSFSAYRIDSIRQFQALQPLSPYSDFLDLDSGEKLSAVDLFYQVYSGDHHLTFQTCIENDGEASWGRLFVMASPIE